LRNDLQLLVLVLVVDASGADALRELSERYPERLRVITQGDERARHRAVAAADFVLITEPSAREGDLHLSGQRYGALPIARKAGAIADGVVDCEASLATGSGFIAESGELGELLSTTQRALAAFSHTRAFDTLRRRAMKQDVSWERSARRYEQVYRSLKPAS
jgi:starch synthase